MYLKRTVVISHRFSCSETMSLFVATSMLKSWVDGDTVLIKHRPNYAFGIDAPEREALSPVLKFNRANLSPFTNHTSPSSLYSNSTQLSYCRLKLKRTPESIEASAATNYLLKIIRLPSALDLSYIYSLVLLKSCSCDF